MDPEYSPQPMTESPVVKGYNDLTTNKKRWPLLVGIVAAVVIAAGLLTWALWFNKDDAAADQPSAAVQITPSGFSPATIKIHKGQDVMWSNQDKRSHQVFAEPSVIENLDSQEPLAQGDAYIFTFEKAGTYQYYDPLNPDAFKATVIVE